MGLVHEQEVDAGVLPQRAVIGGALQSSLQFGPLGLDALLDAFDRAAGAALLERGEGVAPLAETLRDVVGLHLGGYRHQPERGERDHHRVPVIGGAAGDQAFAALGTGALCFEGDQDLGLRERPAYLPGVLLDQVVGDDVGGFGDHPEALHLHAGHRHRQRLSRPDLMGEQQVPGEHDPGRGLALVRVQFQALAQPRRVDPLRSHLGRHPGPERVVVGPQQPAPALGVIAEGPAVQLALPGFQLLVGRGGGHLVDDPAVIGEAVGDDDGPAPKAVLDYRQRRDAVGAPLGLGGSGPVDALDVPAAGGAVGHHQVLDGAEGVAYELLDVVDAQPRRPEPHGDVLGADVGGDDRLQRGDVGLICRVVLSGGAGRDQLLPDVARQVQRRRLPRPGLGGVAVGDVAGSEVCGLPVPVGGLGHPFDVDSAQRRHRRHHRVAEGLDPGGCRRSAHDPLPEDLALGGPARLGIEDLQRQHGRIVGVHRREAAHPGEPPPRRGCVDVAGGALRGAAVERAVALQVGVVGDVQPAAQPVEMLVGLVGGLGRYQLGHGVAHRDHPAQLVGVRARFGRVLHDPAGQHLPELAAGGDRQQRPLSGPGRPAARWGSHLDQLLVAVAGRDGCGGGQVGAAAVQPAGDLLDLGGVHHRGQRLAQLGGQVATGSGVHHRLVAAVEAASLDHLAQHQLGPLRVPAVVAGGVVVAAGEPVPLLDGVHVPYRGPLGHLQGLAPALEHHHVGHDLGAGLVLEGAVRQAHGPQEPAVAGQFQPGVG